MSYDDEDDDFDYDDFVAREFGGPRRARDIPAHWQWVAIGLVLLFVISFFLTLGLWTPF